MSVFRYLASATLALVTTASSASPQFVSANRLVWVHDYASSFYGPNSPNTAQGAFNDSITRQMGGKPTTQPNVPVTATQQSLLSAPGQLFNGQGLASVGFSATPQSSAGAFTLLDMVFDLDKSYQYHFSGLLHASSDGGLALSEMLFEHDGGSALVADNLSSGVHNLLQDGILGAGRYHLRASSQMGPPANTAYGGQASFNFSLDLKSDESNVPEPSTLALALLAVPAALRRKVVKR